MLIRLTIAPTCRRNGFLRYLYLRDMNKIKSTKNTIYFARRWLEEEFTQCRGIKGFLRFLRTNGHLHWRYTSFDFDEKKYKVEHLLRIEVNKAMELDETQFLKYWIHLGKIIYVFANEHGDEFNKMYENHHELCNERRKGSKADRHQRQGIIHPPARG